MDIKYTQLKQMADNSRDWREIVEAMNNQPSFLEYELDVSDIQAILQGGCASGAYMPAVTYHTAEETMKQHSRAIEEQIEPIAYDLDGIKWNVEEETFSAFCVKCVSLAVESWCWQFEDILSGVNWD